MTHTKTVRLAIVIASAMLSACTTGGMASRSPVVESCPKGEVRVCHHRTATRVQKTVPDLCTCESSSQQLGRVLRN